MHNIDRAVPIPMNSLAESQQQQVATFLSGGDGMVDFFMPFI